MAAATGMPPSWELEAAALLSQLGYVSLPIELVEKSFHGEALDANEALLLGEAPALTQRLIARIPRLENVASILWFAHRANLRKKQPAPDIAASAAVLMNVLEFDALVSKGESGETAIATLRARGGVESVPLLAHLAALQSVADSSPHLREICLREVQPGMILMDDLRTDLGTLLVSRGYEISQSFVHRMRNFSPTLLEARVRIHVSRSANRDS